MLQTDVSVLGPNFLVDPLLVQSLSLDGVCSPAESQQQLILKQSEQQRAPLAARKPNLNNSSVRFKVLLH